MTWQLDESQKRALRLILDEPIGIVTGGPGTGKTTSLRAALDELDDARTDYELAAPTGKAAKRMAEATGRPARTMHRLLEWGPMLDGGFGFRRNENAPLEAPIAIVDEASMIDVELGAALFAAIDPERTRVIFVGDANQLPPVGPGRMFGDLIDSRFVPVAQLEHVHRAAAKSWVCRNAPRVNRGDFAALELDDADDFRFVDVETAAAAADALAALAEDDVDRQVLIPQRPGPAGVTVANTRLQALLNADVGYGRGWKVGDYELWQGDRVIQTSNDYKRNVFNGEIGTVLGAGKTELLVDFDGRAVTYDRDAANSLQLAYALTVHKSQGSEWPHVVVVCHSTHSYMLSRQLIYTALTRAKESVTIVGDRKGVKRALANATPARRNTLLPRFLAQ